MVKKTASLTAISGVMTPRDNDDHDAATTMTTTTTEKEKRLVEGDTAGNNGNESSGGGGDSGNGCGNGCGNGGGPVVVTTPTTPFDGWDPAEDPAQRKLLVDLIEKMLHFIPEERVKLAECLNHGFFEKLTKDQKLHLLQ